MTVEEAIHVRLNDNKPNTTMLELDESSTEMKVENIVKYVARSSQDQYASNSPVDDQPL